MSVFQRLTEISRPYRGTLIFGFIFVIITAVLDTVVVSVLLFALLFPIFGGKEVLEKYADFLKGSPIDPHVLADFFGNDQSLSMLFLIAVLALIALFLKAVCDARQAFLFQRFANLMTRDLRQRLFDHLQRLSPSYFETETTGAHLSRITGDVVVLQHILGPQLAELLKAPLVVVMALVMMFGISWKLTLTALCLAPLIAVIIAVGGRKIRKLTIRIQGKLADLNGGLIERLANIRIVQSFVREPHESAQIAALNGTYYRETMRSVLVAEIIAPGTEFLAYTGMLIGIVLGGVLVLQGSLEGGLLVLFLVMAQKIGGNFKTLSRVNQMRQQANGAGTRIFALLDVVPEIQDAADAVTLPPVTGQVVFDQLTFRYATGDPVLQGIDITVQPGEIIALVGRSGAGKTTLVHLLPRFYDPVAGGIRIDGYDLRAVTLVSLRSQIGIVPQDPVLFSGSIADNIRYGKLDASDEAVLEAARAANALEFIERLPEGMRTLVGERGSRLSGGQRQRIAIARALLKNPRILILDEATSALDNESEHLVQQALDRLMQDRTTFVIAHRLSTVKHATRIIVLDQGRIVEQGTHDELLAFGGIYEGLYRMQFRSGELATTE